MKQNNVQSALTKIKKEIYDIADKFISSIEIEFTILQDENSKYIISAKSSRRIIDEMMNENRKIDNNLKNY